MDCMTTDDIKKMFQANAKLRHIHVVDPHHKELEDEFEKLSCQYVTEYIIGQEIDAKPPEMDIQNAMNIIVGVCQEATSMEFQFHPNGMTDEQIAEFATIRNIALNRIVNEIFKKK